MAGSEVVSIAATSSGVTGTIQVVEGARLIGMNLAFDDADGQPQIVELTWSGCPQPLRFVPSIGANPLATAGAAKALLQTPLIPLNVTVTKTSTVTVKVTSNANVTVEVGLMWL